MNLEDETGYEDIDTSEPSSPVSVDDNDDYFEDGLDVSKSGKRGKGVSWSVCLDSEKKLQTTDSVIQDAVIVFTIYILTRSYSHIELCL